MRYRHLHAILSEQKCLQRLSEDFVGTVPLGSLSLSGSEFQTMGPATENARRQVCCVDNVLHSAGDGVLSVVAEER